MSGRRRASTHHRANLDDAHVRPAAACARIRSARRDTRRVTGSKRAMAAATSANACCAGNAPQAPVVGPFGPEHPAAGVRRVLGGHGEAIRGGVESRVLAMWADCSGPKSSAARCASIAALPTPVSQEKVHTMATPTSPKVTPPAGGAKISIQNGKLTVPDQPIIPFIIGDGTGPDIWHASVRVMDAAVPRPTAARRRFTGSRSTRARSPSRLSTTGCPTRPSRPAANTWCPSRDR